MEQLFRDLVIGATGSVIGAFIVFIGTYGLRLGKETKKASEEKWQAEVTTWKSKEMGIRQGITNGYLFDILKYILLGNLFLAVPALFMVLDITSVVGFILYRVLVTVGGAMALGAFFLGLGRTSRYLRLRAIDKE